MTPILAEYAVSVTELKRNYNSIINQASSAVAILNHNKPEAYIIPAAVYEQLIGYLEDLEDAKLILERRASEKSVEVSIDELE